MRIRYLLVGTWLLAAAAPTWAPAQLTSGGSVEEGARLAESKTSRWKCGMKIRAAGGPCRGVVATIPVPTDWPEQRVTVVTEDISPQVKDVDYATVAGTVKVMTLQIPTLANQTEAHALVTLEIDRHASTAPAETAEFTIPDKKDKEGRLYLGPSPGIEVRNTKIRNLAKEVTAGKDTAWAQVEAIYDWVRDNVKYKNGKFKGAMAALRDGEGDCEELSSLFIAICRAHGVPARTVWVPGHCYPEFYLVDAAGQGHWFPCQAAGTRSFGGIAEFRPILQKGDSFKTPQNPRERQRYLAEHLEAKSAASPVVSWVREQLVAPNEAAFSTEPTAEAP